MKGICCVHEFGCGNFSDNRHVRSMVGGCLQTEAMTRNGRRQLAFTSEGASSPYPSSGEIRYDVSPLRHANSSGFSVALRRACTV